MFGIEECEAYIQVKLTLSYRNSPSRLVSAVVPKGCSTDPKGSASSSQSIRGYNSIMATLKVTYFFLKLKDKRFVKYNR